MKFSVLTLLAIALLPASAMSATYQIDWSGEVEFLFEKGYDFELNDGDFVSGSILIDLANLPTDSNPRNRVGKYKDSNLSSGNIDWLTSSVDGLDTSDLLSLYSEELNKNRVKVINRSDRSNRFDEIRVVDRTTADRRGCRYFCSNLSYRFKFDSAFSDDALPTGLAADDFEFGYLSFALRGRDENNERFNSFGFVSIDNVSITAVPLPAAGWMFVMGLLTLLSFRKKRE